MIASSDRDCVIVTISPSFMRVLISSPAPISRTSPSSLTLAPLLTLAGVSVPGITFLFARGFSDSPMPGRRSRKPPRPPFLPACESMMTRRLAGLSSPRRTRETPGTRDGRAAATTGSTPSSQVSGTTSGSTTRGGRTRLSTVSRAKPVRPAGRPDGAGGLGG